MGAFSLLLLLLLLLGRELYGSLAVTMVAMWEDAAATAAIIDLTLRVAWGVECTSVEEGGSTG